MAQRSGGASGCPYWDRRLRRRAEGDSRDQARAASDARGGYPRGDEPGGSATWSWAASIHGEARDMYLSRVAAVDAGCPSARRASR